MIPKRRKPTKMQVREEPQIRCSPHLAWVRGHECAVHNEYCGGRIEAAHVRIGTDGGTSLKPGDNWTLPFCSVHHAQQHQHGERWFEKVHKIKMREIAQALWEKSPAGKRYRESKP